MLDKNNVALTPDLIQLGKWEVDGIGLELGIKDSISSVYSDTEPSGNTTVYISGVS
jgi:hypothetical protein